MAATMASININKLATMAYNIVSNKTPQLLGLAFHCYNQIVTPSIIFRIGLVAPLTTFSVIHSIQVANQVDKERILGTKDVDAVCPCAIKVIKLT